MLPDKNIKCPATGFAKSCHAIVTKCLCPKWVNIKGKDPQSEATMDHWGCVDTFLPKLLIEVAQACRQQTASLDRFNNDMVRMNGIVAAVQGQPVALPDHSDMKLITGS